MQTSNQSNKIMVEEHLQEKTKPKGLILKEARLAKGLSLESVHEATKIPMDSLKAIEQGYTVRTMSPFYYRGFLKIYAVFLNIDPHEVTDIQVPFQVRKTTSSPSASQPRNFEFDLDGWLAKIWTPANKRFIIMAVGIVLALFVLIRITQTIVGWQKSRPIKKETIKLQKVEPKEKIPTSAVAIAVPKVAETNPPSHAAANPAPVVDQAKEQASPVAITVRAQKSSWIKVISDGNTVFQSTLQAGAFETWSAKEKIEITGKNINQLEFELNGKLIGNLGRKDRNAKAVVFTKAGLSVTK